MLKENLIKWFNYCNAIAEDIVKNNKYANETMIYLDYERRNSYGFKVF